MPPRYSYWTILVDGGPTAFRARDRQELVSTLKQLHRRHPDAVLRWFTRGRLWDSPDHAQAAVRERSLTVKPSAARDRDWRPGGEHRDPRARGRRGPRPIRRDRPAEGRSTAGRAPANITAPHAPPPRLPPGPDRQPKPGEEPRPAPPPPERISEIPRTPERGEPARGRPSSTRSPLRRRPRSKPRE